MAITYGIKSIDLYKSVPDSKLRDKNQVLSLIAKALHNLSVVYFKKEDYNNCLISINEAISICEKLREIDDNVFEIQLSNVYNELAWFKYKMHDFGNAETFAIQSYNIAKQHDLKGSIRMSLDTLACIHRELGKTEIAKNEFLECIEICKAIRDTNKQLYDGKLAHEYIELAKLASKNNVFESKELIKKAQELLNGLDDNHKNDFKEVFDELALFHDRLK